MIRHARQRGAQRLSRLGGIEYLAELLAGGDVWRRHKPGRAALGGEEGRHKLRKTVSHHRVNSESVNSKNMLCTLKVKFAYAICYNVFQLEGRLRPTCHCCRQRNHSADKPIVAVVRGWLAPHVLWEGWKGTSCGLLVFSYKSRTIK